MKCHYCSKELVKDDRIVKFEEDIFCDGNRLHLNRKHNDLGIVHFDCLKRLEVTIRRLKLLIDANELSNLCTKLEKKV